MFLSTEIYPEATDLALVIKNKYSFKRKLFLQTTNKT